MLWGREFVKEVRDISGGFIAMDKEIDIIGGIFYARILVKKQLKKKNKHAHT